MIRIFTLHLLAVLLFSLQAFVPVDRFSVSPATGEPSLDSISYQMIRISGVRLGTPRQSLVKAWGKPDKTSPVENEFTGESYLDCLYKGSSFYFVNDTFTGFAIRSRSFAFEEGKAKISVGDSLVKLQHHYPSSYLSRYQNSKDTIVKLRFRTTDSFILFIGRAGIITCISTWDEQ